MNALEIGRRLVELTTADNDEQALAELYDDAVISIETHADETPPDTWGGIQAVREKHAWWSGAATVHSSTAEGPFAGTNDDQFVVRFAMDVTMQDQDRSSLTEVGVYTVGNGKIVREVYLPLAS